MSEELKINSKGDITLDESSWFNLEPMSKEEIEKANKTQNQQQSQPKQQQDGNKQA